MQLENEIIAKFIDACVNDHVEAERLLGAYPQLYQARWAGEHVLVFLVIENFPEGVLFCLRHGFDINQSYDEMGTTPLHYACTLNHLNVARVLLANGADANPVCKVYDTAIHCAVRNGNAELVEILIQHGGNPNYKTELGETIFDNWPPWAKTELAAVIERNTNGDSL